MTIVGAVIGAVVGVAAVVTVVEVVNRIEEPNAEKKVTNSTMTLKEKFEIFKERQAHKIDVFFNWVKENPVIALTIASIGLGFVTEGRRIGDRVTDTYEKSRSRRTVYCNDIQSYVTLRHELNYRENKELRDRMSAGETKFQALDEMGLLR